MKKTSTIRKYRYCHPVNFSKLEKWLSDMSLQGFQLVRYGSSLCDWYEFEASTPEERMYFVYSRATGNHRDEMKYDFGLLYPRIEKELGRSQRHSKLNHFTKRVCTNNVIIEIDKKVPTQLLQDMIADRNRIYRKYLFRQLGIAILLTVLIVVLRVWSQLYE